MNSGGRGMPPHGGAVPADFDLVAPRADALMESLGDLSCPGISRTSGAVYPRACGGTMIQSTCPASSHGLSPRLRGNQHPSPVVVPHQRSIPASAGEPRPQPRCRFELRVYPRACGGTTTSCQNHSSSSGLSPRLRGNRPSPSRIGPARGSIPTPAGEPLSVLPSYPIAPVYPRACGGTLF